MIASHTPGPWFAERSSTGSRVKSEVKGGYDSRLATCDHWGFGTPQQPSGDVAFANARLMAAAPDLLASCQEFLPILERRLASVNPGGIADGSLAVQTAQARVGRIRAAIAKATGESQ